jgi:hypothetical protein
VQSFSSPSPTGLMTTFYCLRFKTPPTWRARSSYLYSPGTGWSSYNARHWVPFSSPPTTRRATVELFKPTFTQDLLSPPPPRMSELHYDWWFTGIQFVLASSPLRLMTRDLLFFQLSPCHNSPNVTSSLLRRLSLALPVWPVCMVLAQTL